MAASLLEVKPCSEFTTWLTNALTAVGNDSLDVASLVDYMTGVLAADAASGEGPDSQRESVRDIVADFEVLAGDSAAAAAASPDTLAADIVDAFNRLCVTKRRDSGVSAPSNGVSAGGHGHVVAELSSAEAEALARVREMTVAAKPAQHPAGVAGSSEKRLILQAYANISDDEADEGGPEEGDKAASGGGGGSGLPPSSLNNREAMQSEEKLRRERMKLEHAQKLERERADREKQKKAKEARKESEKKRTQKQERRK